VSVLVLAPPAILMGMAMPLGIRMLSRHAPEISPWAWGVNGAALVMASVAALVIAILTGFNQALALGGLAYLLALVCVPMAHEVTPSGIGGTSCVLRAPMSMGVMSNAPRALRWGLRSVASTTSARPM
jgi:hypothetical protein